MWRFFASVGLLAGCACPAAPASHPSVASGGVWWVRPAEAERHGIVACELVEDRPDDATVEGTPLDLDARQQGLCDPSVTGIARIPLTAEPVDNAIGQRVWRLLPASAPGEGAWIVCCDEDRIYGATVVPADATPAPAEVHLVDTGDICDGTFRFDLPDDVLGTGGCVSFRTAEGATRMTCTPESGVWSGDLPLTDVQIYGSDGTVSAAIAVVDGG